MKTYTVHFHYINTGRAATETITVEEADTRPVENIVKDKWVGLLCGTGGLRCIDGITQITDK